MNNDLASAVRAVQIREGVEQISLLGYCFGGTLTTIYAALYPRTVKNLITFTLPIDMSVRELPAYALVDKVSPHTINLITSIYGNCPAWLIKAWFDAMDPVHHALNKYVGLYRNQHREGYQEMFNLFEQWMNSDVPLAGQIFREITEDLLRNNLLMQGCLHVAGQPVNPKNITCSVLNVIAEHDDVVHPNSSLPLIELTGSRDARNLFCPTGHIGAAVSRAAHKQLWPQVGTELKERPIRWANQASRSGFH